MNRHLISIICSKTDFENTYSFLFFNGYPVLHFNSIQKAVSNPEFYNSRIVIFDLTTESTRISEIISSFHEKNHHAQIILAWDFDNIPDSDTLLRLFYCIRKPFTPEKLLSQVERAIEKGLLWECRRDVRIPVEIPVDFYYNARVWMTSTTNLSLDGMQAVWPEPKLVGDIAGRFRREHFPFLCCRLYVEGGSDNPVPVPVSLKYIAEHEDNGDCLMGFSFGDLPSRVKTKLYETIAE